jgi:Sec-independent protein translocase protein TatA
MMFNINLIELVIIIVVATIFINPKDLPKLFRKLGRLYRKLENLKDDFILYLKKFEKEIEDSDDKQ